MDKKGRMERFRKESQERFSYGDINFESLGQLYRLNSVVIMFEVLNPGWQIYKVIMLYSSLFLKSQQRGWTRSKQEVSVEGLWEPLSKSCWVTWLGNIIGLVDHSIEWCYFRIFSLLVSAKDIQILTFGTI